MKRLTALDQNPLVSLYASHRVSCDSQKCEVTQQLPGSTT
jgi:hypothetical protein